MFQQVAVGAEHIFWRARIQPNIYVLRAHLEAAFEHDVDRIGQEIFALKLDAALHLLFNGCQQVFGALEVIKADHRQVVIHFFWLFYQPSHPAILPNRRHPKAARVGHRLDPDNCLGLLVPQER